MKTGWRRKSAAILMTTMAVAGCSTSVEGIPITESPTHTAPPGPYDCSRVSEAVMLPERSKGNGARARLLAAAILQCYNEAPLRYRAPSESKQNIVVRANAKYGLIRFWVNVDGFRPGDTNADINRVTAVGGSFSPMNQNAVSAQLQLYGNTWGSSWSQEEEFTHDQIDVVPDNEGQLKITSLMPTKGIIPTEPALAHPYAEATVAYTAENLLNLLNTSAGALPIRQKSPLPNE